MRLYKTQYEWSIDREPTRSKLLNERVQNSVSKNYNIIPDLCVFF